MNKKATLKIKIVVLLLLISSLGLSAQVLVNEKASQMISGAQKILLDKKGQVKLIQLSENNSLTESTIQDFLDKNKEVLFPNMDVQFLDANTDNHGLRSYRYSFFIDSIPVEYAILKFHADRAGNIKIINGELYPASIQSNGSQKQLSQYDIEQSVLSYYERNKNFNPKDFGIEFIRKVYYPMDGDVTLSYEVEVESNNMKTPFKKKLYLNIEHGSVMKEFEMIHENNVTGKAITMYNDTVSITTDSVGPGNYILNITGGLSARTYDLNTTTNYSSAVDFTDTDNLWYTTTDLDHAANDAHYGSEKTLEYYQSVHGRNSYDNQGATVNSYVHYGSNFPNAFWDGSSMTYGDGDGLNYEPFTSTDIVGHEITHGVTTHTADLIYADESGALNESFSDIFGVTIDYFANPNSANFLVGDQVTLNGSPFRNMQDPNSSDQPDTYLGNNYYTGFLDNGGVHTNSQVQNYWYYLLCMGGSGTNDLGNNYSVSSIGMNKAADIAYRTLTTYLSSSSDFMDARTYSILSAIDLYGTCSNEVKQVTEAWYAVGVGGKDTLSVVADFTTPKKTFCSIPATVNFTENCINTTSYLWDFGDGSTDTIPNPSHTYASAGNYTITLMTSGSAQCSNSDTLVRTNYITTMNSSAVKPISCMPSSNNPSINYGIIKFELDSIYSTSAPAIEGYQDFSCEHRTTLIKGSQYLLSVKAAGPANWIGAWIDANNDGAFNLSERVIAKYLGSGQDNAVLVFTLPNNIVLNTPLRLRVFADDNIGANPCSLPNEGQYEDYGILVTNTTQAPIADFMMSTDTLTTGGTAMFTDLSKNGPSSWSWTINGGNPYTSSTTNPSAVFSSEGTYHVTLTVSNSFGSDSITKTIRVIDRSNFCDPSSYYVLTGNTGLIYDNGGPNGDYTNDADCNIVLEAGECSDSLEIVINQFSLEFGWDYLDVYDDIGGTSLLASLTGYLPSGSRYVSTTGVMYLHFTSDEYYNQSGFEILWKSHNVPSIPAGTQFSYSPTLLLTNETITFVPDSTGPSVIGWDWDFGDGTTSKLKSPTHSYSNGGAYTVKLKLTDSLYMCTEEITRELQIGVEGIQVIEEGFTLYPNPFNEILSIESEKTDLAGAKIKIYNILGQEMTTRTIEKDSESIVLDMQNLNPGNYIVQLRAEDKNYIFKVTKF